MLSSVDIEPQDIEAFRDDMVEAACSAIEYDEEALYIVLYVIKLIEDEILEIIKDDLLNRHDIIEEDIVNVTNNDLFVDSRKISRTVRKFSRVFSDDNFLKNYIIDNIEFIFPQKKIKYIVNQAKKSGIECYDCRRTLELFIYENLVKFSMLADVMYNSNIIMARVRLSHDCLRL